MNDHASEKKMKEKLFVFWLLLLLCIPLLSFYGRLLQLNIMKRLSTEVLTLGLGGILGSITIVLLIFLLKKGRNPFLFHLVWVAPLAFFLYASLPFVEKVHIALFGLFGFLSQRIFEQKMTAILCVAVSFLDELFQHFLVARVGDWRDVWLNVFSVSLGMFLAFLLFGGSPEQPVKSSIVSDD